MLHSFPVDHLTQTVMTDDDWRVSEVRQRGTNSRVESEDVVLRGHTMTNSLKQGSILWIVGLPHLLTQDHNRVEASPEMVA